MSMIEGIEPAPVKRRKSRPPAVSILRNAKVIPFGWYGGKYSHLDWLLPLLPKCHHYCEPFAGSGAVLLNRKSSPVETYNDLDGEVVNFFRVLRDESDALVKTIALTPFSREEFATACKLDPKVTPFERARRFYVRARQVRIGLAQTATLGRWANCKNTSRSGMSGVISRWLGGVEDLPVIAERLLRVQIENRPAVQIIQLYDSPGTLFYCDPPYIHDTRGDSKAYGHEMTNEQHEELADALNSVQGMVAISNYPCELMDSLYPAPKWRKIVGDARTNHATKGKRIEVLWTNYDPMLAIGKQTGALGDVEITLANDNKVVTTYEMKDKTVTMGDIDIAIQKIAEGADIQNYIFVTTEYIDPMVREYAAKQYKELGGVEIAILDCVGFLRHFLHLFHRLRTEFLDAYQELVLSQPESGVNQALKEAFLALRKAAQAAE